MDYLKGNALHNRRKTYTHYTKQTVFYNYLELSRTT